MEEAGALEEGFIPEGAPVADGDIVFGGGGEVATVGGEGDADCIASQKRHPFVLFAGRFNAGKNRHRVFKIMQYATPGL
jgi:hypothetical protein